MNSAFTHPCPLLTLLESFSYPLTSKVLLILKVQLGSHLPLEAIAEYLHFSFANIISPTQVRPRFPLQGFEYTGPWKKACPRTGWPTSRLSRTSGHRGNGTGETWVLPDGVQAACRQPAQCDHQWRVVPVGKGKARRLCLGLQTGPRLAPGTLSQLGGFACLPGGQPGSGPITAQPRPLSPCSGPN